MISIVVLTFNSELTIAKTLSAAALVSDDLHVVDSFSTDRTLTIAQEHRARIVQHEFEDYGAQRNWCIDHLPFKYRWQMHLDADEYLSAELIQEINHLKENLSETTDGYFIPRLTRFLGRDLAHGGLYPQWHMRLFRSGKGRCESRKYDQHFYVEGNTAKLHCPMIDDNRMSLSEWTARHNRWAEAEVEELLAPSPSVIVGKLSGTAVERKRALKSRYYQLPLFIRPALFFLYRYFVRLGFLDGIPGLVYFTLQSFWFRFLVDAKLYERTRAKNLLNS